MGRAGCTFNGGSCYPVVEACEGCSRIIEANGGLYCQVAPDPRVKWRMGTCNLATHVKDQVKAVGSKLNPLKASKRAAKH